MNFRRIMTAMVLLAFCVGLANAQVVVGALGGPAGALACSATVAVPPQLRSEGLTELIGDIVLSCTGGVAAIPGSTVPTVTVVVSLGTNVTSRLLTTGPIANWAANTSEALLFIDEPQTNLSGTNGAGPAAAFTQCGNTIVGAGPGGCSQIVATTAGGGTGPANGQTASSCTTVGAVTNCTAAANVYQGNVTANQVAFNGVPVNPPVSTGIARVYRITNIRANVNGFGGGGLAGTTQLLASVSISGSASVPVNNPVLVAGLIQSGLSTSLRNNINSGGGGNTGLPQCGGGGPTPISIVRFSELITTGFRTRVAPTATYNGQSGTPTQSTPGTIYNSESGLVLQTGSGQTGLTEYGTRLKATFNNIPLGVNVFVSTSSVLNDFSALPVQPVGNSTTPYAVLILNETSPDSNGFPPIATSNSTVTFGVTLNIFQLTVVNNSATAVWEVLNSNPNALDTLDFAVYESFTANPGANSPPVGTATVNMSYAPTPTAAFSAAAGGVASSSLTIPRFADTSTANSIFNITLCQTVLLYPFVTNQSGFDTGLAIANTTSDPFSTRTQNGTCTLSFYGASAPAAVTTPSIATGTVYANLASSLAPNFQGYTIAVCNFSLAHGFAFVSDLGARNLAMGYLANVVGTGTGSRSGVNNESQGQ